MANIKSQIKRNKQTIIRNNRNTALRSEIKTLKKLAVDAAGTDDEAKALAAAIRKIDIAEGKNIMHRNKAARQKSKLTKKVKEAANA